MIIRVRETDTPRRNPLKVCRRCADNKFMRMSEATTRRFWGEDRGFTLPEVLITVVLIGIVMSIASSTWFRVVESRQADSAANQLLADLRLANSKASNQLTDWAVAKDPASLVPVGLLTDPDADYYVVRIPSGGAPNPVDDVTPRYLPEDAQIDSTQFGARFKPNGSAEQVAGFPTTATVGSDGNTADGPSHSIEVNRATSRVQIDPNP